jgi:hypothetical protein
MFDLAVHMPSNVVAVEYTAHERSSMSNPFVCVVLPPADAGLPRSGKIPLSSRYISMQMTNEVVDVDGEPFKTTIHKSIKSSNLKDVRA